MNATATDLPRDPATFNAGSIKMLGSVQAVYGSRPEDVIRFGELARPTAGDGEVLVRVAAASVDFGTVHIMTGTPYPMRAAGFGLRSPKLSNPGRCLAGTVESLGKGVTGFVPGDPVYGTGSCSFAQYAVAEAKRLAPKPANLSFEQAAAAPISGVTALQAVRKGDVQAGEKVLVIGASGGVGSYAVQIARAYGAEVTGVCRTSKMDMVRELGADHIVDYTEGDFLDGQSRYDVIIDTGGNSSLASLRRALTPAGRLVIVGGETDGLWLGVLTRIFKAILLAPFVKHKLLPLISSENAKDLSDLTELIESSGVSSAIDRTYPLSEADAAIRYVQEGKARGKVVISVAA